MVLENQAKDLHIAGGAHKGIVINKNASLVEEDPKSAYVSLEFCVFLSALLQECTQKRAAS